MYKCEDLSKNTKTNQMQIYERVIVKKIDRKRANKIARIRSEIQYYMIKVLEQDYVSTRSTLFEMKNLNLVELKRINAQLNRQNKQLLVKLNQCRKNNEHSNIKKQLTKDNIEKMS